jgi:hypothetical protein
VKLRDHFDAVVMLTWSDWDNEPRSNRYHYATRFAKVVPTFFLQHRSDDTTAIRVRAQMDAGDLSIVDVHAPMRAHEVGQVRALLAARGVKRPLLWIYDPISYAELLGAYPRAIRVYHATEGYFTQSVVTDAGQGAVIQAAIARLLSDIDLVVAVTRAVADSLVEATSYDGRIVVAENGCDYAYFAALAEDLATTSKVSDLTVVYQGALNTRVDYDLLCAVIQRMPDARFRFFGKIDDPQGASRLAEFHNAEILGAQLPEVFGRGMIEATVGIIPFIQDQLMRDSLPLKAYEYVACGLPVVTVPIDALEPNTRNGIFEFASTAEQFVASIRRVAASRFDPEILAARRRIATANSYDERFSHIVRSLASLAEERLRPSSPLSVGMLVDISELQVGTIYEHISAFERFSENSITLLPATDPTLRPRDGAERFRVDFSMFDVLIVHYTVRLTLPGYFDADYADALERFGGLKVLFVQDEYENVECTRSLMERIGFDLVYTCVPPAERQKVYPDYRFPATEFLPTLTGFVPEHPGLDEYALPLEARRVAVAYRGRELPAILGKLAHEKYRIGIEFSSRAEAAGLPVDIACDGASRIYGDDWYRFLGSARAALGTESGSNVFDFDGSLAARIMQVQTINPKISFEEIWERVLAGHDGAVRMNQISPRIFEAIRLRTAMVLFEGEYSGVVKPDVHFIPLKKDFSNFDEVVAKVLDDEYVRRLTDRAYEDVIESGRYSYRRFVEEVDEQIRLRTLHRRQRSDLHCLAIVSFDEVGDLRQCLPAVSLPLRYSRLPYERGESAYGFQQKIRRAIERQADAEVSDTPAHVAATDYTASGTGRLIGLGKRVALRVGAPAVRQLHAAVSQRPVAKKAARVLYFMLPERLRSRLTRIIVKS